jgi:hypothetical protein
MATSAYQVLQSGIYAQPLAKLAHRRFLRQMGKVQHRQLRLAVASDSKRFHVHAFFVLCLGRCAQN